MSTSEASLLMKKGEFGTGSMGPKVEAAVRFVEGGGERAVIADLDQALGSPGGGNRLSDDTPQA